MTSIRGRQRNRANSRPRHLSKSRDWRSRRSVSRNRKDADERELSDQFESITFESITVDAIAPRNRPKDEVFVTVGIDLHKGSNRPATLKAKLDKGAQGNILPVRLYRQMYTEYLTPDDFPIQQSPTMFTAYGGDGIKQHGKCVIT